MPSMRFRKNAQSVGDFQAPAFCFETPFPIINQKAVCGSRKRQGDGRPLTGIEGFVQCGIGDGVGLQS